MLKAVGEYVMLKNAQPEKRESGLIVDKESMMDRTWKFEVLSIGPLVPEKCGLGVGDLVLADRIGIGKVKIDENIFATKIDKIFGVLK